MNEIGMRALGAGIAAVEGVARNPEATGKITTTLVIGSAFAEATAIYGLLVSILLIFVGVA